MVKRDGREGKEGSTLEMNNIKENIIYSNHDLAFFFAQSDKSHKTL